MSIEIKNTFNRESGHWYNENGLVNKAPSADGKRQVTPDIRHAKKFNLRPSVTTLFKAQAKPQLEIWKIKEHIKSAFHVWKDGKFPKFESDIDFDEIAERNRLRNDQAQIGTDAHAEICKYTNGEISFEQVAFNARKACEFVRSLLNGLGDMTTVRTENFFCLEDYAGTVDGFFANENTAVFADYKTTDDDKVASGKCGYLENAMQLSAYRWATDKDGKLWANLDMQVRYLNIYIGRVNGEIFVKEWTQEEIQTAYKKFVYLKAFWYAQNGIFKDIILNQKN